jgi:hypothetical protein
MTRYLALFGVLAAAFALFFLSVSTPDPLPPDAPPTAFSAGRAMSDIAVMAPVPHPIGSPANHQVRDYLVQRMTALGLAPGVQQSVSMATEAYGGSPYLTAGVVQNVVGVLPGRDHSLPALALMAHYDSVPGSPGAADDITSVATALEIVRAIKAEGTPARDVMLVITDGEEPGLLGARAFFHANPLAAHVGFVLNMDTRGGGGRAAMFETVEGDGAAIDLYRRTAAEPNSNSLAVFVYRMMPNDTDFTIAKAAGKSGFNYAFIGRQFDYHSPSSSVAALDQGSVQHMGDQVLPTAEALAFSRNLPAASPDVAYADLFGLVVITYPPDVGWYVLGAAAALVLVAAGLAARAKALSLSGIAMGLVASLGVLAGATLVLALARWLTGVGSGWIEYRPLLAGFPAFETGMALSGLGVALLMPQALARRFPAARASAWIGLLLAGLIAAGVVQFVVPVIAPVVAWPLLLAAASAAVTSAGLSERQWTWIASILFAAVGLAWLGVFFHTLLQGLDLAAAPALVVWLAAPSLWPLAWPERPERVWSMAPGLLSLFFGLGVMAWLHLTSPWTPRHPRAVEPRYLVEADQQCAWRIAAIPPDGWTLAVLKADDQGDAALHRFPTLPQPVMAAPAKMVAAAPPTIAVQRGADGTITATITPAPGVNRLSLDVSTDTQVAGAAFDGKPMPLLLKPGEVSHIVWHGSDQPFTVSFRPSGPGVLTLAYAQELPAWPSDARPLPPLPPADMAWDRAGVTMVTGVQRSSW